MFIILFKRHTGYASYPKVNVYNWKPFHYIDYDRWNPSLLLKHQLLSYFVHQAPIFPSGVKSLPNEFVDIFAPPSSVSSPLLPCPTCYWGSSLCIVLSRYSKSLTCHFPTPYYQDYSSIGHQDILYHD